MTETEIQQYLTDAVQKWRRNRDSDERRTQHTPGYWSKEICEAYVDAFQSVHQSLFGTLVPIDPPLTEAQERH